MKLSKKKDNLHLYVIAGVAGAGVVAGVLGTSISLRGQVTDPGYAFSGGGYIQRGEMPKPDLSITRTATDVAPWNENYAVQYVVTNNGAKATQAYTMQPAPTGSFDEMLRVYIPSPITFAGMKTDEGTASNRVNCGIGGYNLRCVFYRGIDANETLRFTVFYAVNKNPVQCDKVVTIAPTTVAPGLNLNPISLPSSLRNDANPADNTTSSQTLRVDCASITGDLETTITGPETIGVGRTEVFYVSQKNVGSIYSSTVPIQISAPAGFEILKAEGMERGGMCGRDKNQTINRITCSNPSTGLNPGQGVTFKITLKARTDNCGAGELKSAMIKPLKTPNPKYREIYDINDNNNSSSIAIACDPSNPPVTSSSSSTSSSPYIWDGRAVSSSSSRTNQTIQDNWRNGEFF